MKHNVGNAGHAAVRSIHMISHARDGSQRSLTRPVGVRATSVWRERPAASDHTAPFPRVIAGRWRSLENQTLEVQAQTAVDSHLVCIALRRMNIRLSVSGNSARAWIPPGGSGAPFHDTLSTDGAIWVASDIQ